MNWVSNKPFPKNGSIEDGSDLCEHVEADNSLANWIFCEDDAFGPVIRNVVCKECKEETLKEMAEEEECCWDCRDTFKMKDLKEWRGYYFNRNEGDEPLLICKTCLELPTHQRRIKKKEEDRAFEEGDDEPDYDDYHYEEDDVYPEEDESTHEHIEEPGDFRDDDELDNHSLDDDR